MAQTVDINKVWKALEKYGIYSEQELDEAIKNMKPLNIGCMVAPLKAGPQGEHGKNIKNTMGKR